MNPEPTVTCSLCGRQMIVEPAGQGFPPDVARRKLRKLCAANGCASDPVYMAGVQLGARPSGMGRPQ